METAPPIEVRRYGPEGPPLVVLHGGPGAPGSVASLARALAAHLPVWEPLQRRSGDVPLTVARHVADLAAVLPPEPLVLLGWSWGAMLALSFAARHPGRARALLLVGCGTYDTASRAARRRILHDRLGRADARTEGELQRRLAAERDPAARDALLEELGRLCARAQSFDAVPDPSDRPADARGFEETWADVLRLQERGEEPAAFAAVRCPVRMLHGADDPHPGRATRDALAPFVADLAYREFERCGHAPWLERHARDDFLAAVRGLVAELRGA
jgi:pimeloyl-ACP methyl ester carboxylesterase